MGTRNCRQIEGSNIKEIAYRVSGSYPSNEMSYRQLGTVLIPSLIDLSQMDDLRTLDSLTGVY